MQCLSNLADVILGGDTVPRYETQCGREKEPLFRSAKTTREISMRLGLEVEGKGDLRAERSVDSEEKSLRKTKGIRHVSSGRVRQIYPKSQEKVDLGLGQAHGVDRRSGFARGSDPVLGRVQGRYLGLGLDNRVAPSPSPKSLPSFTGLDSTDPCHLS